MDTTTNPHVNPIDLLTTSDVADLLSVCDETVRRMARGRKIPHMKVGRQYRFSPKALTRWINSGQLPTVSGRELV